jgi:peptidyl-tRNA hydrolase, PTH1 family
MHLVAGLGNPGDSYANNRHNIGFMAADEIARRHSFGPWRKKFRGLIAEGQIDGEKILLLKPQNYMNLSGESVGEAMRFYGLPVESLTVLYDELDLAPAKLRVKIGGGAGGHNGIRSIDSHCGNGFKRIRLGIGRPDDKRRVKHHVLSDFAKVDREWLEPFLASIAENFALVLKGDDSTFMNRVSLASGNKQSARPAIKNNRPKGKSHIHQARQTGPQLEKPRKGPLADILTKLFGTRKD